MLIKRLGLFCRFTSAHPFFIGNAQRIGFSEGVWMLRVYPFIITWDYQRGGDRAWFLRA